MTMMQPMNRALAAELGQQTASIVAAGRYPAPSGRQVHLGHLVRVAVDRTIEFAPTDDLNLPSLHRTPERIAVKNTDTFSAARTMAARRVAVLNFASAKRPGGGWLSGARAQEESLARSSALVATLQGRGFYEVHQVQADPVYTDHVIYSPDVPVFRDHAGALLDAPWTVDVITAAAVNAKALLERDASRRVEIDRAMTGRIERVLQVAAHQGAEALVLGAWGCGAFRNDPEAMAARFRTALQGPFRGVFATVEFAIVDWSKDRRFLGPFARAFGCALT